jgi:hypothetical protein
MWEVRTGMSNSNRSRRREFSREEDELIIEQANGNLSMTQLLSRLRTSRDIAARRADELGVTLRIRAPRVRTAPASPDRLMAVPVAGKLVVDNGANPYRNEPDLLLDRLCEQHGDRRYESIAIKGGR